MYAIYILIEKNLSSEYYLCELRLTMKFWAKEKNILQHYQGC